ncbi:hypothetical protein M427DRAFT_46257 [Gonapodya prolifera JEL478]|uniref:Uncharacterized protein n=1 Tax=Gonapodya prolifera (strain JEL478) TaxID=1344416 RepID=A0A139A738_GONPJ|nr:hypothetical protein M427DRAFT_46257 [Gonapodya prolifera JEL478]|eukprot:KXS12479.1 hypothetical protein M427DRAFT_46257 [Gonapodya prolifera JEL478]
MQRVRCGCAKKKTFEDNTRNCGRSASHHISQQALPPLWRREGSRRGGTNPPTLLVTWALRPPLTNSMMRFVILPSKSDAGWNERWTFLTSAPSDGTAAPVEITGCSCVRSIDRNVADVQFGLNLGDVVPRDVSKFPGRPVAGFDRVSTATARATGRLLHGSLAKEFDFGATSQLQEIAKIHDFDLTSDTTALAIAKNQLRKWDDLEDIKLAETDFIKSGVGATDTRIVEVWRGAGLGRGEQLIVLSLLFRIGRITEDRDYAALQAPEKLDESFCTRLSAKASQSYSFLPSLALLLSFGNVYLEVGCIRGVSNVGSSNVSCESICMVETRGSVTHHSMSQRQGCPKFVNQAGKGPTREELDKLGGPNDLVQETRSPELRGAGSRGTFQELHVRGLQVIGPT